jgi:hypothetical protein
MTASVSDLDQLFARAIAVAKLRGNWSLGGQRLGITTGPYSVIYYPETRLSFHYSDKRGSILSKNLETGEVVGPQELAKELLRAFNQRTILDDLADV